MKTILKKIRSGSQHVLYQAFVPLASANQSPMFSNIYGSGNLSTFLNVAFKTALSVGAILAVLRIAFAGYMYMTSDAWGNKVHAKEILGNVVLGLLLLLGTYLILNQINPNILNLDALQSVKAAPTSK